ncbi:MAG TPA: hypothetical protein VFD82_13935 [Planctomycetota bacterium]|nr:hypothetical protein [Planctomycetota bacterium]
MRPTSPILTTLLAALPLTAQDAAVDYQKMRTKVLAENGQRHLQLGSWARDQGLVPQATAEFLLAVEVAEGKNPGAITVLGIMRKLDEGFWTQRKKRPSRALLDEFEKRARRAVRDDREGRFKFAHFAHVRKLEVEALRDFRALIGDDDAALQVDDKGRIVLDVGTVPEEISARILDKAVKIDERRYPRDEELRGLPDAATIHERESPGLRVRGTIPQEQVADLHALGLALLPHLEDRLGGRPVQRVKVFVFGARAEYAAYLAANAMQRFERSGGFADYVPQQAIVCAEGCNEADLRGLFLHELTHLYDYQFAPASLPSWYAEAFAETFGGNGAYRWQDGRLEITGRMPAEQRQKLAAGLDNFSLRELLAGDVGTLWAADAERARRFYVESWGLLEFLRFGAGESVAARFAAWEALCRGKALGAKPREPGAKRQYPNATEARQVFEGMFGAQLQELQRDFLAWARDVR